MDTRPPCETMRRSYAGFAPEDRPMAVTTIDLNLKALDALKLKVHESTRADVVRKALALLDALTQGHGPEGASFRDADELEALLLQAGPATPMTAQRKARIYGTLQQ